MQRRAFLAGSMSCCSGFLVLGCVKKPTMALSHAQVTGLHWQGISMAVFLRVFNDNSFDVQVREVRVSTVIQQRWQLPPLRYSPQQWLPADRSVIVRVPLVIPWPMVVPLLGETISQPQLTYRVRGEADVTATRALGLQVDKHPINEQGVIPRAQLLAVARQQFPHVH